jgi:hypothetical protein
VTRRNFFQNGSQSRPYAPNRYVQNGREPVMVDLVRRAVRLGGATTSQHVCSGARRKYERSLKSRAYLLTKRLAVQLPSTDPICYPFMEVGHAYDGLYPCEPHIVSDNVAHSRESECDTPALERLDES